MDKKTCNKAVFYARMDMGYLLKMGAEMIKGYIPGGVWFDARTDGTLEIKGNDSKNNVALNYKYRDFSKYHCRERQTVCLDIQNFFRMIRNCRKKTSLSLLIENSSSNVLWIGSGSGSGDIQTRIHIDRSQPIFSKEPVGYEQHPCLISAKDFQTTCKEMHLTSSKEITVTQSKDGSLVFKCGFKMYGKSAKLGSRVSGDKPIKYGNFSMNFEFRYFMKLVKVANISKNVRIYFTENKPIKICFDIDNFGDGVIYIKSKEGVSDKMSRQSAISDGSDFDEFDV